MSSDGSVTCWIDLLRGATATPPGPCGTLLPPPRRPRPRRPRRRPGCAADEEDVALSAFDSFCRGDGAGRFPRLDDRDDLWRLLLLLTARKAAHLIRDEFRAGAAAVRSAPRSIFRAPTARTARGFWPR